MVFAIPNWIQQTPLTADIQREPAVLLESLRGELAVIFGAAPVPIGPGQH